MPAISKASSLMRTSAAPQAVVCFTLALAACGPGTRTVADPVFTPDAGRASDPSYDTGASAGEDGSVLDPPSFAPLDASTSSPGADASAPDAGPMGPIAVPPELAAEHCDPNRPGFRYKASTGPRSTPLAAPASGAAPIPCYHATGYGAAEPSIVITKNGTVMYAPVFTKDGSGVLTSDNHGKVWNLTVPKLANGGAHGRVQPYMARDPDTDRVILATNATVGKESPELLGFNLSISDDSGQTWTPGHLPIDANDWVKIYSGKPRVLQTTGYPNVFYASAPNPISTPVPVAALLGVTPTFQTFFRSLDGGKTWQAASRVSLLPAETPGCDPNEWVIFGSGAVAPDGTAYQGLRRCTRIALATSRDDGTTWTVRDVPGSSALPGFDTRSLTGIIDNPNLLPTELLAVDAEGTLYLIYVDAQWSLRLQVSKDGGGTFSTPVSVQAPNVNRVVYGAVAVQKPGTLAIGYYGSSDWGHSYHGYIAETQNAFEPEPSFASVTVNPANDPLYNWGFEVGYLGILELADLNEIIQVKYAPNGDIWGSFAKDKCEGTAHYGKCYWDLASHENSGFEGVIGRFVHDQTAHFAEAPAAAPPPGITSCQRENLPEAAQCVARLNQASSGGVCAELGNCMCDKCRCEVYNCDEDPKCTALLVCAAKNNCRGQECLVICPDEVKLAGDLMVTRALAVATCGNQGGCPAIQFCPLDWLFPPGG